MHLVQILLPITDNSDQPFPENMFADLRRDLTANFGGVTVFSQGSAEGFWQGKDGTSRDEIVIFRGHDR